MAEQESAAHAPGSVMQAWTPAWTLNGRLLRPAMVVVAKAPPGEIEPQSGGAGWTPPPDAIVPRLRTRIRAPAPCPAGAPLNTSSSHFPVGTPAVLRAARVR